ncbi:MAG: hypothetical protein IPL32_17935 [Chloracidobacterium sp.]|nr:hypothetical protein [Chloracidobacterium sp.]
MTQSPYVKSNYPRVPGEYYPTIDPRCVNALLECVSIRKDLVIFDVCAPQGSGIIDALQACGRQNAFCKPDAFEKFIAADWVVTNPPFTRPLVDQIIERQIERQIERMRHNEIGGFACLLRSNFDHAKSRQHIFKNEPLYSGQIKMLFRPLWFKIKKKGPIHNYVWHIWKYSEEPLYKTVNYADGDLHE